MNTCSKIAIGFWLILGMATQAHALAPMEWSHAYVLVTRTDPQAIGAVTESAHKELPFSSEAFLDIVAEIVAQRYDDETLDTGSKRRLWMLLYESDNPRYLTLLLATGRAIGDHKIRLVLKEVADEYRRTDTPQYQPGAVSLKAIQAQYLKDAENAQPPALSLVQTGMDAAEVFSIMGKPQAVDAEYTGSFFTRRPQLLWIYSGRGAVVLQKERGGGPDKRASALTWHVVNIIEDSFSHEYALPDTGKHLPSEKAQITAALHSQDLGLRRMVETWYEQETVLPVSVMDVLAERLMQNYRRANQPKNEEKAFRTIARILERDGEGRYATLFEAIEQNSRNSSLRRIAKKPGAQLKKGAQQYRAGNIDLEKLKKEYPVNREQ